MRVVVTGASSGLGAALARHYARRGATLALLARRVESARPGVKVVNASISGETTSGGRSRLPAALQTHKPASAFYTNDLQPK